MNEEFDQTSQEIRLTSPTGGKLEYIVGAYYEDSNLTFEDTIQVASNSVLVPLLNNNPAFCLPGSVPPFSPQPPLAPLCGIAGSQIANTGTPRVFTQDAKSYSVFTQLSWKMSEQFRPTIGLRYTKDEKMRRDTLITDIDAIRCRPLSRLRRPFTVPFHGGDTAFPTAARKTRYCRR